MCRSPPCAMWAFIEHIGQSNKISIGRNQEKTNQKPKTKNNLQCKIHSTCNNLKAKGVWPIMTWRWLMKAGNGQGLGEDISDNFVCAQRDEFNKHSLDKFAHKIAVDVNVARNFLACWIFTHSNTGQIIVIDFNCILLLITKVFESFTKIDSLLPGLAVGNDSASEVYRETLSWRRNDTLSIDNLFTRQFVNRSFRYHLAIKRVRELSYD